ncbi:MAG TPA: Zn-dependent hydrolase [Rhizobiaceae bacterium]|nr:Zn-dependent hydrolase [Rhizobiaceae bacterium]
MTAPDLRLASALFKALHDASFDGVGITRDTYGEGEQRAHDIVGAKARELGLEVRTDAALNLYMTLPGRDRSLPAVMTGSHLDSVPRGGNYDGAAGVIAGLAVLAGWIGAGHWPEADTTVMAVRAEESVWFPVSYAGSKAAFGLLPRGATALMRQDGLGTLGERIDALKGDSAVLEAGEAYLDPKKIARFVELHIEQGPVLLLENLTVGIVTGIRGSFRYREAKILGQYGHSGATPRAHRHDAVVAVAELISALNERWVELEEEGRDLSVTFGRVFTDPEQADFSKVSGRVDFCIDVRSFEPATLTRFEEILKLEVARIEQRTGTRFELGERTSSTPAPMDPQLQKLLLDSARAMAIPARAMPSGAGHDTATFALAGVPTVMIFIRNENGSHNPDEKMEMADFAAGARLLSVAMAHPVAADTSLQGAHSDA